MITDDPQYINLATDGNSNHLNSPITYDTATESVLLDSAQ